MALLDGDIKEDKGEIDLPLRLDIEDRPRQLVCKEHGKPAKTKWEVIKRNQNRTKVYFYPITGRTHQPKSSCRTSKRSKYTNIRR